MSTDTRIAEFLEKNPLLCFSLHTDTQVKTLTSLGKRIIQTLDDAISADPEKPNHIRINAGREFQDVYGNVWLWVIGAYEVVRTMCQAKDCFPTRQTEALTGLKRELHLLRIPFAKQEQPGKKAPIDYEATPTTYSASPSDVKFQVQEQPISIRELIEKFADVLNKIPREDILAAHRSTYRPR